MYAVKLMQIPDDRSRKGTDSEAALEPKEFFEFVNQCKTAFSTLKKINFNKRKRS